MNTNGMRMQFSVGLIIFALPVKLAMIRIECNAQRNSLWKKVNVNIWIFVLMIP